MNNKYVGLFSGGKDSLVMCHYLWKLVQLDEVVYSKTGIGLDENFDFVLKTCQKFNWKLNIVEPKEGETYEDFVREVGFPHKGIHSYVMGCLKYHPWRKFAKEHPGIIFASARRKQESKRRSKKIIKIKDEYEKDGKWLTFYQPIVDWSDKQVWDYIRDNNLEICPVYETLHLSGDCLCGSFAKLGESYLISTFHKKLACRIAELEQKYGGRWGNDSSITGAIKQNKMDSFFCNECRMENNSSLFQDFLEHL